MLQRTGCAFREKCNLHTDYNNQEILVFELVRLKVDILNFLYIAYFTCVRQPYAAEFRFFFSDALQLQRCQRARPTFIILQKQRLVVFMSLQK